MFCLHQNQCAWCCCPMNSPSYIVLTPVIADVNFSLLGAKIVLLPKMKLYLRSPTTTCAVF